MGEPAWPAAGLLQKYVSWVMCGTRNGWMAVVDGAQNVVVGVASAATATRNSAAVSLFICFSLQSTPSASLVDRRNAPRSCKRGTTGDPWRLPPGTAVRD